MDNKEFDLGELLLSTPSVVVGGYNTKPGYKKQVENETITHIVRSGNAPDYLISDYVEPTFAIIEAYYSVGAINRLKHPYIWLTVTKKLATALLKYIDGVRFDTVEDVERMSDYCVTKSSETGAVSVFPVTHVFDYETMFKYGLFPTPLETKLNDILTMTDEEYLFWNETSKPNLSAVYLWEYAPISEHIQNAVYFCEFHALIYVAPRALHRAV